MKSRLKAWGDAKIVSIASIIVVNDNGHVLLLRRHSQDLGGGKWGTPAGRLDDGESASDAAIRELREETGIVIDAVELLGKHEVRMPHGAVHMTTYRVAVPNEVTVTIDPEEHHEHQWFDVDGLLQEADLLWGVPTTLRDFGFIEDFDVDPTLNDGTQVIFLG